MRAKTKPSKKNATASKSTERKENVSVKNGALVKRNNEEGKKEEEEEDRVSETSSEWEASEDEFVLAEDARDEEDEDDMTVDAETEKREGRLVEIQRKRPLDKRTKDRLDKGVERAHKRFGFNLEKITKKYSRLTEEKHVGTEILYDNKDGKWKYDEGKVDEKTVVGYITNFARKSENIGYANISAPCNGAVFGKGSIKERKRCQQLDEKFNNRLAKEESGTVVVWGKGFNVPEPSKPTKPNISKKKTKPIFSIQPVFQVAPPVPTIDADYLRMFYDVRKNETTQNPNGTQSALSICSTFFIQNQQESSDGKHGTRREAANNEENIQGQQEVQLECEVHMPVDESSAEARRERKVSTMNMSMDDVTGMMTAIEMEEEGIAENVKNVPRSEPQPQQSEHQTEKAVCAIVEQKPLTMLQMKIPKTEPLFEIENEQKIDEPVTAVIAEEEDRVPESPPASSSFTTQVMPELKPLLLSTPRTPFSKMSSQSSSLNKKRNRTPDEILLEENGIRLAEVTRKKMKLEAETEGEEADESAEIDAGKATNVTLRKRKKLTTSPTTTYAYATRSKRYMPLFCNITPSRPPSHASVILGSIIEENQPVRADDQESGQVNPLDASSAGETLWFQNIADVTEIFSDSKEAKTVWGIDRTIISSDILNNNSMLELWLMTPSFVENVDESFDDFDKQIRRMQASARQRNSFAKDGYV